MSLSLLSSPSSVSLILQSSLNQVMRVPTLVGKLHKFLNLHTLTGPSSHVMCLTILCALGGESKARHMVGGMHWWQVHPRDSGCIVFSPPSGLDTEGCVCLSSLHPEWVMDRGDWREAKQHEKAAAARVKTQMLGESTNVSPHSPSSSSGAHMQRGQGGKHVSSLPR